MKKPSVLLRLSEADRSWRKGHALEAFFRSLKYAVAIALIALAADVVFHFASGARMGMSLGLMTAAMAGLALLAWQAFVRRSPLLRIARHLESRDEALGSKLVNVLQLEHTALDESKPEVTRALAGRAVEEASVSMEGRDFRPLAKSPTLRRAGFFSLIPVAVFLVPALISFGLFKNQILRFLDPYGDHPPFSLTQLKITEPKDDALKVIYKKPATIEATYAGHRPDELFLTIVDLSHPEKESVIPLFASGDDKFVQQIDSVTTDLAVTAHTSSKRSVSPQRKISVILTPQLENAAMTIHPPAYTKMPSREAPLRLAGGTPPNLSALSGSWLEFRLESNRPLGNGTLAFKGAGGVQSLPLTAGSGKTASTATGALEAKESGRLTFDLRDETGLSADRELAAALTVTHDLPPEITLTEPQQDGFIVDTFAANVVFTATDDYGLKTVRIHTAINEDFGDPKVVTPASEPPARDARESVRIAPSEMGSKAGDLIKVFADATDIRPEPQQARSRTLTLQVISEEQYNDYLRMQTEIADLEEKFARFQDEVRALAREQRELAEEAAKAEADPKGATQQQRDELAAKQSQLNEKLNKLADQMSKATREKPLYDLEKDLQKVLDKEADTIRKSVAKNADSLQQFASQAPSQPNMDNFEKAANEQADTLDPAAKESEQQIADALKDAQKMQEMLKSLNAFQELYERQKEIAEQSAAYKDKRDLSTEDKLALQSMAAEERAMGEKLQEISEQLLKDAKNAEDAYPQAAQDARDFAYAMEQAELSSTATSTARSMNAGKGGESHSRATLLKEEMEKFFTQCSQCKGAMGGEFEARLKLMRGMMAGNTFSQMAQCKNFGQGKNEGGMGIGTGGTNSSGSMPGQQHSLLGGESMLGRRDRPESATASNGSSSGSPPRDLGNATDSKVESSDPSAISNRASEASPSDPVLGDYDSLVDAYFRKLTAPKETEAKAKEKQKQP